MGIAAVYPSHNISLIQAFSAAVKARRHALDISQEELAHRAEVGRTYVARLEVAANQSSLSARFRLCSALEVTPAELLEDATKRMRRSKQPFLKTP